jgi:hypothetical protein
LGSNGGGFEIAEICTTYRSARSLEKQPLLFRSRRPERDRAVSDILVTALSPQRTPFAVEDSKRFFHRANPGQTRLAPINEFLPISMPMVATDGFVLGGTAASILRFPCAILRGDRGRTIPLADMRQLNP